MKIWSGAATVLVSISAEIETGAEGIWDRKMHKTIEVGDVVTLKSGSAAMTVVNLHEGIALVSWWSVREELLRGQEVAVQVLKKVDNAQSTRLVRHRDVRSRGEAKRAARRAVGLGSVS